VSEEFPHRPIDINAPHVGGIRDSILKSVWRDIPTVIKKSLKHEHMGLLVPRDPAYKSSPKRHH
jgi:hypothetical protein